MSKDPFWTKKQIDKQYFNKPKKFPVIVPRTEKKDTNTNVKRGIDTHFIIDTQDYPDKFYEGFYFRGKDKIEALKGDKSKPKTFKMHDWAIRCIPSGKASANGSISDSK